MRYGNAVFWVPLLIGLGVLLATYNGNIWYTSDSHFYIEGAIYLREHGLSKLFFHPVFQSKPLLFSVILMPFTDDPDAFGWLQVILFSISYFLIERLGRFYFRSISTQWFFNLMISTSTVLIMDHIFIWTESVFIGLLSLYAWLLIKVLKKGDWVFFSLLTICALLICLLKHVGIFFVVPAALLLMVRQYRKKNIDSRWFMSIMHLFVPVLYFLLWQYLIGQAKGNYERIDHFTGVDLLANYLLIANAIGNWFGPEMVMQYVSWALVPMFFWLLFRAGTLFHSQDKSGLSYMLAWMQLAYFLILITKADMIFSDDERYASVIFPFALLMLLTNVESWSVKSPKIKPLILSAGGVILLYNIVRVLKNGWYWSVSG